MGPGHNARLSWIDVQSQNFVFFACAYSIPLIVNPSCPPVCVFDCFSLMYWLSSEFGPILIHMFNKFPCSAFIIWPSPRASHKNQTFNLRHFLPEWSSRKAKNRIVSPCSYSLYLSVVFPPPLCMLPSNSMYAAYQGSANSSLQLGNHARVGIGNDGVASAWKKFDLFRPSYLKYPQGCHSSWRSV